MKTGLSEKITALDDAIVKSAGPDRTQKIAIAEEAIVKDLQGSPNHEEQLAFLQDFSEKTLQAAKKVLIGKSNEITINLANDLPPQYKKALEKQFTLVQSCINEGRVFRFSERKKEEIPTKMLNTLISIKVMVQDIYDVTEAMMKVGGTPEERSKERFLFAEKIFSKLTNYPFGYSIVTSGTGEIPSEKYNAFEQAEISLPQGDKLNLAQRSLWSLATMAKPKDEKKSPLFEENKFAAFFAIIAQNIEKNFANLQCGSQQET